MPMDFLAPKRAGIDLGTANILVYVKGQGIVMNEPSVVARHNRDNAVVAVGEEARAMQGRTPGSISVIRPMRDGVIADYLTTEAMLRYFIGLITGRFNLVRPEVMVTVPAGVTSVEQRAVRDAAEQAGARKPAHLVPEPLAAAIGAQIPIGTARGNMIVNIGGGRTEAAVISLYGIVVSESVRMAGDRIDEAIVAYVRRRHNLLIGEQTAEEIKDRDRQRTACGRGARHAGPRARPTERVAEDDFADERRGGAGDPGLPRDDRAGRTRSAGEDATGACFRCDRPWDRVEWWRGAASAHRRTADARDGRPMLCR